MPEADNPERFVSNLTRQTLALILAGGRGSRLKDLTRWRAKPAVPFGGKFRIIDFPLSNCVNSGIRRVGVVTQYKADSLIRHVQKGWGFLRGEFNEYVDLMPAQQRLEDASWYAGTADAVYQNLDLIRNRGPKYILILAGDHIYKMDYGAMLAKHAENKADLTIGCLEVPLAEAREFGVMHIDREKRILDFVEKPDNPPPLPGKATHSLASMGIYIFNTDFLFDRLCEDADSNTSSRDFGKDIIPSVIGDHRVFAYPFKDEEGNQSYWRDVGTLDAYWATNMELVSVSPELDLYDPNWPIWTYQEQLPPAKFVFDDDERRGMAVDSMVSGGCIVSGSRAKRSLLFSNVRVNSFCRIEESVVLPDVEIGRNSRIHKAIIDKGCKIPKGTVIGENPEEDKKRFYVTDGGITLVTADMLGQDLHYARLLREKK